jgi:alpha-N-arabinofuranosidase
MIRAEVTVNTHSRLGNVDPLFYGQFVESLDPPAKPIYGGVVNDEGVLREDVIDDLREMQVPVIRWGGNYGDFLHWEESIGPRENRPMRFNYQWGGHESNQFGTHEFLTLCERLNAEPYININMGTGTLQEALAWLEYCNYSGDTTYTRLRKANGRSEPWHGGFGIHFKRMVR